ncbi:replication-relaxation family protein [Streptomyces sp. NPDC046909]|uniref:replication-relaxation family protein n=1 Tax=Streptomyces sp. NPDC046909 TaxID=3155617 RepID=UPI0033C79ABC
MITNPTQQRALRGHRPQRLSDRAATTGDYIARLSRHLTDRDRWLARMLYEHKVLTTHQIAEIAHPSTRAANTRLLQLYKWRLVDRFQPFITSGSAPMHYVLDVAGAAVLAREDGLDPRDLNYKHERAIGLAHSLHLAHTVGTNAFFTALIARSREPRAPGKLTAWWSESRCRRHFGDIVLPDGYGRWQEQHAEFEWFLEFDLATERPARVAAKLPRYAQLAAATGITTPVLIWMPTTRREARVRQALTTALGNLGNPERVPVATATTDFHTNGSPSDPSTARWQPLTPHQPAYERLRLAELGRAWPHLPPLGPSPSPAITTGSGASGDLRTPPPPPPLAPGPTSRRPGQ